MCKGPEAGMRGEGRGVDSGIFGNGDGLVSASRACRMVVVGPAPLKSSHTLGSWDHFPHVQMRLRTVPGVT